jgi:hypothetical protein
MMMMTVRYCNMQHVLLMTFKAPLLLLLQELIDYRAKYLGPTPPPIMALGLSSRKNLCIHPQVAGAAGLTVLLVL